jgi:hypothetical protein
VHADNSSLFDLLKLSSEGLVFGILQLSASPKLGEASNDKMANLVELRVTRYEEHVSCDAVLNHGLARDAVVA